MTPECALVQSVDFFTPVVDSPDIFGEIAAANSLSDIYAVGAKPLTVLNVVAFPASLDNQILVEILKGSAKKVLEAGAVVAGGHTVEDDEPKFGLSVTGIVDPAKMITSCGGKAGDRLYLTKRLGTGINVTALKGGVVSESDIEQTICGMRKLNKIASEVMVNVGVNAATDISGFSFAGHAHELALASGLTLELDVERLPLYQQCTELAAQGFVPEGAHKNRAYYRKFVSGVVFDITQDILYDPQTSGGLLIAVSPDREGVFISEMTNAGEDIFCIGGLSDGVPGNIICR